MTATAKLPTLKALRAQAAAEGLRVFSQGNSWIKARFSPSARAWIEAPLGYEWDGAKERQVLASLLGYSSY